MQTPLIRPRFKPSTLNARILHIGFGAFARAHLMVYLQDGLDVAGGDFGVVACRLNSGAEDLTALDEAGRRYLVAEVDGQSVSAREIAVVVGTCHPRRDGIDALLDLIASQQMAVISLTITEKGYCCRNGHLDLDHSGIRADLGKPESPKTAIGVIVAGLKRRRDAGLPGLTVLSCDNQPDNGKLTRTAVLTFAREHDGGLADWIDANVTFPGTMVDRVVPALDSEGAALLKSINAGNADPNGIVCEPFRQWVIEDDFAAGLPPYEDGGAMLTGNVHPFEMMKLRMLNGAHTFLAMLGSLAGLETVDACMADPVFRQATRRLMLDEQRPTLPTIEGVDIPAYADALIIRFANPKLKHRTGQIASDTSQKLPQRLLSAIADNLEAGRPWPLQALAVAGWMRFVKEAAQTGVTLADPLSTDLLAIASKRDGEALVDGLTAIGTIFDKDLATHPTFRTEIIRAYGSIVDNGPREAVADAIR